MEDPSSERSERRRTADLPPEEYCVVYTTNYAFYVTHETAQRVTRQLDRRIPPRWIVFRDWTNAYMRIPRASIDCVAESTSRTRTLKRAFFKAREKEEEDESY